MKKNLVLILTLLISLISNAQKYILLNDLKYKGEIAYFNDNEFTGNAIQKKSNGEITKLEKYNQGKKSGVSWSIDGYKNIYILNYTDGILFDLKMINEKKDTIINYVFNKKNRITEAFIKIEIKDFHSETIPCDTLCKLNKLLLQTCLYLTNTNDSLSVIKLDNVRIESFLLSSPGFIDKSTNNHYDREWKLEVDYVDKQTIESLCKYYMKWISFGDVKLITKEGFQFRFGGREYLTIN
jgi:hypothetical protein